MFAPAPRWIDILYCFMTEHPEAGACQPKLRAYMERENFEYAGACGGYIDRNGYPYCRGRILPPAKPIMANTTPWPRLTGLRVQHS